MVVDFETACEELTLCSEKYCPFIAGKITGNDPCNASYCHIAYAYKLFANSLGLDDKKVMKTVRARTHFISCAYYCYLAVRAGKSQDEINSATDPRKERKGSSEK